MTVDTPAIPGMALMLQHLADAVYLLDPDSSRIVWGNHAAWESLGLSPEQVLDHSVLSLQMDVAGGPLARASSLPRPRRGRDARSAADGALLLAPPPPSPPPSTRRPPTSCQPTSTSTDGSVKGK